MHGLLQELRLAARSLTRSGGFTAVALLTLALGIGANSAIFTVVNAVLLRPLPVAEPDQLLTVFHYYPSLGNLEAGMAAPTFLELQERANSLGSLGVRSWWSVNATGQGEPERLHGALVSGEFFSTLGVSPARGRTLQTADAEGDGTNVVVISDGLWRRRFGSDPGALGNSIQLNGEPYEIVGVMPAGFRDPFQATTELWAPLTFTAAQRSARTNEFMAMVARLTPGVGYEQATQEMTVFAEQLKADNPGSYPPDWSLRTRTVTNQVVGDVRPALLILLGAVGFVLLIACANVANLLLARAAARQRDYAVRAALGASRADLARQLFIECGLLALIGGAFGLGLAWLGTRLILLLQPDGLPRMEEISIDPTVVGFTLMVALLTGLLFGVAPALRASRTDLQNVLRQGGRSAAGGAGGEAVRRVLIVSEFALALLLLVGAGLLLRSFAQLTSVDPGFVSQNVLTAEVSLPSGSYTSASARVVFTDELLSRLAALPAVGAVGATTAIPFGGGVPTRTFVVEGYQPGEGEPDPWGDSLQATPGYLEALGIPLLQGRFFTDADRLGSRLVAVVDRDLAERYWPGADPIGRRIGYQVADSIQWMEVVGVVEHTAMEGLDAERRVQVYRPALQTGPAGMVITIRSTSDPSRLAGPVRATVHAVDPSLPVSSVRTMDSMLADAVGSRRFSMLLLALFAGIALLLASIGIYGVISFDVARRTRELGLRMALGAERGNVLRHVLRDGVRLAVVGVGIGLVGAFWLTRLLASQLYGVRPTDPLTFLGVAALLIGVAVLAVMIPARRATGVDPMVALRGE